MILILNQLILSKKFLQNWINERFIPLKNEFEKIIN